MVKRFRFAIPLRFYTLACRVQCSLSDTKGGECADLSRDTKSPWNPSEFRLANSSRVALLSYMMVTPLEHSRLDRVPSIINSRKAESVP